jgi:hypothetical protein
MAVITLPYDFFLRSYQVDAWGAIIRPDFRRGLMVVPRRNGKDILCWNALICKAFQRKGLYYYVAPFYNQIRQIIWEGFNKEGRRFLDYIPSELITSKTKIDMRIDLANGSQIKLQGSDQIDRIVGTNPIGVVFTEFSLHKPGAWEYLRPVLAENGGWALFNGTPRGLNHFYDRYQEANNNVDWFVQYLTRDDTGVPTLEAIEADRRSGMPDELIQQEYYCSFMSGVVGNYYATYINHLREAGKITSVPYEPRLPTYTAWDLGVGDATSIWCIQHHQKEFRLIDYYENEGEGLPHYIKWLREKPYAYSEHFAPHDIEVRELTSGRSRKEIAAELGIQFTTVPKLPMEDGIEAVREILPQCWFDAHATEEGIRALSHYQKTFNEKTQSYSNKPLHNWASNGADAFRYFALVADTIQYSGSRTAKPRVYGAVSGSSKPRVLNRHSRYQGTASDPYVPGSPSNIHIPDHPFIPSWRQERSHDGQCNAA